jgi:hypothetical protein
MAQVVQPDGRQARPAKQLLELPVVVRGSTGVPTGVVNTQKLPRHSEPAETRSLVLLLLVVLQGVHELSR